MAWTAKARVCAAAARKRRIEAHDAECLPFIRSWRTHGMGWRKIARLFSGLIEPPGSRLSERVRRGGWTPEAVRRIAARHGIG